MRYRYIGEVYEPDELDALELGGRVAAALVVELGRGNDIERLRAYLRRSESPVMFVRTSAA